MWKAAVLVALLLCVHQASGDFGSFLNSATDAISNAAGTVGNAVTSATDTVGNAVGTATDAVGNAANSAVHTAQHTVDVSENWVGNTVGGVTNAVVNFTQAQWDAAGGVADQVGSSISSVTGAGVNVGRNVAGQITDTGNVVTGNGSPAPQAVDATDPAAISAALAGAQGFSAVGSGILQAIVAGRGTNVADATATVIVQGASNETTQVQIAQAYATAMGVAQNDSSVETNATQVAEVFMAAAQNAIGPCASGLQSQAQPGTPEYSQAVADGCCSVVDRSLTTLAMVSDLIGTEDAFYAALQDSDTLGTQPRLNLGKCITDQTEQA